MISGVIIQPLKQISDARGKIMHMLRNDSKYFQAFGEIYFSCVNPGAIKAWHVHKKMILNYAVPYGNIRLVLFDNRIGSQTKGEIQEIYTGSTIEKYFLITIPPLVWNGFMGLGSEMSIVANCASIPHDPYEIERLEPFDPSIPYNWRESNP